MSLTEGLKTLRMSHYTCEDCWYSCPKSPDGCCNESQGDECNCGADKHNAKLDEMLALAEELEKDPWIAVTERLPASKDWCLVVDSDGEIRVGIYLQGSWAGPIVGPVTHWMPLPDPPLSRQQGDP